MVNLVEILKDAPQGLKLYSLTHGEVTLNKVDPVLKYYPIITIDKQHDITDEFSKDGKLYYDYEDAECILFPTREHRTWDGWQSVLFQMGDVIVSQNETPVGFQIFLCYGNDDRGYLVYDVWGGKNYITPSYYRYATPEERDQFFKELNANGYYWNENTKQMEKSLQQDKHKYCLGCVYTETKEESFTIDQFKPFDKVLVRYNFDSKWEIDLFERYDNDSEKYSCLASTWNYCIPYNDETSNLLGTKNDCQKKYKTW